MIGGVDMNCDEDRVIASKRVRYVIAAMIDDIPQYLKRVVGETIFVSDIGIASMTLSRTTAKKLLAIYKTETGDPLDCVILPIEITYEILEDDFR